MFRRKFLQLATLASAGALAPMDALATVKTATYHVKGFSCITCATGLDTMLAKEKGIQSSKSTYPEGLVKVAYDPKQTNERSIVAFITDLGFTVDSNPA
ncbi:hypothetical protein ACPOL_4217 [Acidisarcina polymorpha]|uniref:HMA domain-containing protein n=1 Tax=Acidisarcina polymorpha TaxID=2211140 RepID=A0A2Z5G3W4_9BACT|nr:heavy-metal-associated domain-containing protein [Acidisarcina polymorpha]AXC13494.1 hypothetical protein ACPOL_4217 [Acidisarcina polymorpha]